MKLHDAMKRLMALLLTFALMVGMVGTEAMAAEFYADPYDESGSTYGEDDVEGEGADHVHNQDGWFCVKGKDTKVLTCTLEEHTHTDACYAPAPVGEGSELICGLEESEGHQHSLECYAGVGPTCGTEESEGHKHGDDCYTTETGLVCEIPEGHVHTVECYNIVQDGGYEQEINGVTYLTTGLICTIPENHVHDDTCYGEKKVLTCELAESEGHRHTIECFAGAEPSCGLVESEGHVHSEACYAAGKQLVCGKEEHTHTDECYTIIEGEWKCQPPENDGAATIAAPKNGITVTGDYEVNGTVHGYIIADHTMTISGDGTLDASGCNSSAIVIKNGASVTITGSVTIKGGTGTYIQLMSQDDPKDYMEPRGDKKCSVGGGVYVENGTLILEGGTITGNEAQRGGGIFVNFGSNLIMTGGEISENKTVNKAGTTKTAGEGGGIFVYGTATISGGSIKNNHCNSLTDLGGGGLYISNSGKATLINATVTDNTADGYGGGIAGCCHGEMSLVATDGVALYGNHANGTSRTQEDGGKGAGGVNDIIDGWSDAQRYGITKDNAKDFYTAGSVIISNYMAGGGSAKYTGKINGSSVTILDDEVRKAEKSVVGLVAHPTEESIDSVPSGVEISGNTSTVHGGGIGCNGGLFFGTKENVNYEYYVLHIALNAAKTLDGKTPNNGQFQFQLMYEDRSPAGTASNDGSGNINFSIDGYYDEQFVTDHINGNTMTLYMKEIPGGDTGIAYDKSEYKIILTLDKDPDTQTQTLEHRTPNNKFSKLTVKYTKYTYTVINTEVYQVKTKDGTQIEPTKLSGSGITFANTRGGSLTINKKLAGGIAAARDHEYTFTVTGPNNYSTTVTVTGEGSITLEGLAPGPYTVTENDPQLGDYTWTVDVPDGATATVEVGKNTEVTFTNTFTPKETTWSPEVKKSFAGDDEDPNKGKRSFDFKLTLERDSDGVKDFETQTVTVNEANEWTATFDQVTFTKAGTYTFKIAEIDPEVAGYTYGLAKPQTITVVVADNNGQLVVTSATSDNAGATGPFTFTNTFDFIDTTWTPSVQKHINTNGHEIPENYRKPFTFTLTQDGSDDIRVLQSAQEAVVDCPYLEDTSASFAGVTFTQPGTYHFEITEKSDGDRGYTYDTTVYHITVEVTDNGSGVLEKAVSATASKSKTEGRFTATKTDPVDIGSEDTCTVEFTNEYAPVPVDVELKASKTVVDENGVGEIPNSVFTFKLEKWTQTEDGKYTATAEVERKSLELKDTEFTGEVTFKTIRFEKAGVYTYRITEEAGDAAGYSYDGAVHNVTITVTDENGQLVATVKYDQDAEGAESAAFVNTYNPGKVYYKPQVAKMIIGEPTVTSRTFTFVLKQVTVLATDGKFTSSRLDEIDRIPMFMWPGQTNNLASFKMLEFTKPGTYVYQIEEVKPDNAETGYKGYTFDETVWTLTIVVSDHDGVLTIDSKVYTAPGHEEEKDLTAATFENHYDVTPTSLQLSVLKKMTGDPRPGTMSFRFDLKYDENNNLSGFVMPEYSSARVTLTPNEKEQEGTFGSIEFTKAGKYTFFVNETIRSNNGYTFDETVHEIIATVVDRNSELVVSNVTINSTADGKIVEVQDKGQVCAIEVEFTNDYKVTETKFAPNVTKHVVGDVPRTANHQFTFVLEASDEQNKAGNAVLPENTEVTLTISGGRQTVTQPFEEITFKQAGTYYFTISELRNNRIPGYGYDTSVYQLVVDVKDIDGNLQVREVTVNRMNDPEDDTDDTTVETFDRTQINENLVEVHFWNFYETEETRYNPVARKTVVGTPTVREEYTFAIELLGRYTEDEVIMPRSTTVSRYGAGEVEFDEIIFTKAGRYQFVITEQPGNNRDCEYDDSEWILTVTVVDRNSRLVVESATYTRGFTTADEASFVNRYTTPEPTPTPTQPVATPAPSSTPAPSNTPAPSATPAPSTVPSEQPTPSTPSQQEYPERNDNPNNPNNPNVPEDQPNMDVPNPDIPLADMPNNPNNPNAPEDEPGMDLPEPDVPLGDMPPQTGESIMNTIWMALLVASGAGILITVLNKRREER